MALVDLGPPDRDGHELARELRAMIGGAITLIARSGYGAPQDLRRSQAAGFDAHLTKPVPVDELDGAIAPRHAVRADKTVASPERKARVAR